MASNKNVNSAASSIKLLYIYVLRMLLYRSNSTQPQLGNVHNKRIHTVVTFLFYSVGGTKG